MSARRTIAHAGPLLLFTVAMTGPAVAQEAPEAGADRIDDALMVAVQGVLGRLQQQGSVPAEPRVVVTPAAPYGPGGNPPTADEGTGVAMMDALAERLGARVAELEEVQQCAPDMPGACTLQGADAVVSLGALQGTAERASVDVLVTYAVPRIVHEPVRSVAYRVDLSRLGREWTVTSMRSITTM